MKGPWAAFGTVAAVVAAALVSFQIWFFNAVFDGITDMRARNNQLDREVVMAQRERIELATELQRHKLGLNGHGE